VLVLSSGNVVHNLRRVQWNDPDGAFDWNERFDDAVLQQLDEAPADILRLTEHPDYRMAVPTPDHFVPLLYTAGLAMAGEGKAEPLVRGYAMGSLSMASYGVGADVECETADGAATIPEDVPADQSNI
jgi:4,5-DOPA dioxygenase extradiol